MISQSKENESPTNLETIYYFVILYLWEYVEKHWSLLKYPLTETKLQSCFHFGTIKVI